MAVFICLMRMIYSNTDFEFNLEKFLGRASMMAESTQSFTMFYEERNAGVKRKRK